MAGGTDVSVASRADVLRFVEHGGFNGYQAVPLPHGLAVPGKDQGPSVEIALRPVSAGTSVLDVGACYGLFSLEATRRGASRVVALEPDPARAPVARDIARLWGDRWEVHDVLLDDYVTDETFDVVLFLNVLHHVLDPVGTLRRLLALTEEVLVLELCQPSDQSSLARSFGSSAGELSLRSRIEAKLYRPALRVLQRHAPVVTIGPGDSRSWYFSREALVNLLVRHTGWVTDIDVEQSPRNPDRLVAFCRPSHTDRWSPYSRRSQRAR